MRGIVVKQGLYLSWKLPECREKLKEVWIEMCLLVNSWLGEEVALS